MMLIDRNGMLVEPHEYLTQIIDVLHEIYRISQEICNFTPPASIEMRSFSSINPNLDKLEDKIIDAISMANILRVFKITYIKQEKTDGSVHFKNK